MESDTLGGYQWEKTHPVSLVIISHLFYFCVLSLLLSSILVHPSSKLIYQVVGRSCICYLASWSTEVFSRLEYWLAPSLSSSSFLSFFNESILSSRWDLKATLCQPNSLSTLLLSNPWAVTKDSTGSESRSDESHSGLPQVPTSNHRNQVTNFASLTFPRLTVLGGIKFHSDGRRWSRMQAGWQEMRVVGLGRRVWGPYWEPWPSGGPTIQPSYWLNRHQSHANPWPGKIEKSQMVYYIWIGMVD